MTRRAVHRPRARFLLPFALAASFAAFPGGAGLPAQSPSWASIRETFEKAVRSPDAQVRADALAGLERHPHPETVRYLLGAVRENRTRIEALRNEMAAGEAERTKARTEKTRVDGLVKTGKLGEDAAVEAKAAFDAAEARMKALAADSAIEKALAPEFRKALARVIGLCDDEARKTSVRAVIGAAQDTPAAEDRAPLLESLAAIDHPDALRFVEEQTAAPEAAVRVAALGAIEGLGGYRALRPALKAIHDPVWQVQVAAVRILRKVGGSEAAWALADVLEKSEGRVRGDALTGLRELTGQDFHENVHLWRGWLEREAGTLPKPTETENALAQKKSAKKGDEKPGRQTGFYGIDTPSKRLVYVIDYSGSMLEPLDAKKENTTGADNGPGRIGGKRKIDGAVTELLKSIDGLPKDASFNIVFFGTGVVTWQKEMQTATPEVKAAAKEFVLKQKPLGATNLFGGLESAFVFAGRGTFDKRYKISIDSIYLLSDGSPTAGRFQAAGDILREIKALNSLSRVAIHCVGLGKFINAALLTGLTRDHDGVFVHIGG